MSTPGHTKSEISVDLTPLEHRAYFSLYEKEVFRSKDTYRIIPNKKTARQILSRLKQKGYVLFGNYS